MPHVTDTPPPEIQEDLAGLERALDERVPPRTIDRTLLVATWNVRAFGGLTEKWVSTGDDSPKRDLQSIHVIAAIIRRFDVVALQEVKGTLKALRHTMKLLGPNWGLLLTDVTRGSKGNDERLGFLYDRRTVQPSGLAGELVVPREQLDRRDITEGALREQFARTPYAVSFRAGDQTFILVTLHVLYGDSADARTPELRAIAEWLDEWARDINAWDHNLVALGDFNIDRRGDERYEAFTSTGLTVPDDLNDVPRTIFGDEDDEGKFYDQIAWFTADEGRPALSLDYRESGAFDFQEVALPRRGLSRRSLSWRVSDHYPLWAAFEL
ncbi:endonuclease/exonuclease/phosphatase family protein [Salinigranum halophilum]|jgi:endonuclease/exonuclease/phosphatase family metal-dependent hydrolase|uniref:endonuclease/exonuclease/phosphatase family protein n=1 Tax=Salinigranum halophilum TaxID=2565931 RepID=UPI0010A8835B|nr:endonuclease/exonuclease/phosphatase family protein [Salinigranum halophilum]